MGAQWLPALAAPASKTITRVAPALGEAAKGGNVLVVLRNQYTHLNLRTHGRARVAATRSDQRGIVAAIRASGGTVVARLVSVNAIAAKISAAEVSRLRHDQAVKEIAPNLTAAIPATARVCPATPKDPRAESDALRLMDYTGRRSDKRQADRIATGAGVVVASLPAGCGSVVKGDAPGASVVNAGAGLIRQTESRIIQGIDNAVIFEHAAVIVEPFELTQQPGQFALYYPAFDAAVAAGVTVVAAAGDSGAAGPMSSPATDPNVIAVGASTALALPALAYGFTGWESNNVSPVSSGEVAPNNRMVDLVAPAIFFGTGEASAFVGGAAADVIQAYAATHHGAQPTPAMVKEILTGTAQDLFAPQGQQGAGQVDIYAAVQAAQQMPGTSDTAASGAPALIPSPTQVDVTAAGGTTSTPQVTLYNASPDSTTVTGVYRNFGAPGAVGSLVTEPVTAPNPGQRVPAEGAQAATPITFTVPAGLSRIQVDMTFPDPTNNTILSFMLIDPNNQLAQISYDGGYPSARAGQLGTGPDIQHAEIANPAAGTWTAEIFWSKGLAGLLSPPEAPGSYRGNLTFQVTDRAAFVSTPALSATTIPGHSSITVPLSLPLRASVGDQSTSVQFTASNGASMSLPVNRRTLVPSTGGSFFAAVTSTDSDGVGQLAPVNIDVPAGENDLDVSFAAPDASPDDPFTYYLVNPNGAVVAEDATPTTTTQGSTPVADADLIAPNPMPGQWEIDVELNQTESGLETVQLVSGTVSFNQVQVSPSGLPSSQATTLASGSSTPVQVSVTNNANTGRSFTLSSNAGDVNGGACTTAVYLAAGQTGTLTANLTPAAAPGTAVQGMLSVMSNTSAGNWKQVIAALPYSYTVGPA
jgi:hypothetical protein